MRTLLLLTLALPLVAQVKIVQQDGRWAMERNGAPYFVKGAVVIGGRDSLGLLDLVKSLGGNAARTGPDLLDELQKRGMTSLVDLPVGKARMGFDYDDTAQVEKLHARIREIVARYKDHPALLLWTIGNEPNIGSNRSQARKSYEAIEKIARMIKAIDGKHPVITVIGDGEMREFLPDLNELCPSLDAIGLNAYHSIFFLKDDVAARGWKRPYLITEFGPRGHWQVVKSPWGLPLEDSSTEKAAHYRAAYQSVVSGNPACLGSFVFLWYGKHQEKTHTWYNMFLADGSRTGAVDAIGELWSGSAPQNRSPELLSLQVNLRFTPLKVKAGAVLDCQVALRDAEGDPLQVEWDLRPDVSDNPNVGGDKEPATAPIPGSVVEASGVRAKVQLPDKPGAYRLFVYARDGRGGAATANRAILAE